MISRASMKQQMKGNKMKKKPVQKKNIGKMLETFSPVYSIMKGKGPMSKLASNLGKAAGPLSPIGMLAKDKREEAKKRAMAMQGANKMTPLAANKMTEMQRMMAGGPIKRKRSIDGCARKGKTRAV
jgi:hypothetical protein|tara:strand:+ start:309 stop:686 length:378 start_codon:yes stop_codon:yes gene_type:complete